MLQKEQRILIVDDYNTMRRIIRNILKQIGFDNVADCGDGVEALAKLREERFDLVICDWNMEPMMGLDVLKAIRRDDATKAMPVLMIVTESKPENIIAAMQAGVDGYIVKPF